MIQAIETPIILFDGTSVSNPGVAAAAAVLLLPNGKRYTVSQFLSFASSQQAKYIGLIIGLRKAKQLALKQLEIKGESELILNQVNGLEPVTDKSLQKLYQEAQKLILSFEEVNMECISKERNRAAAAAVNRCIGEALDRENKTPTPVPTPVHPKINHLLQLGRQAREIDYQNLAVAVDDYSFKPLPELRSLIAPKVQDAVALQWKGNENQLAEIYRWILRGLPPLMAVRKVQVDYPGPVTSSTEKLPWEGELISPKSIQENQMKISEPFLSSEKAASSPPAPPSSLKPLNQNISQKETLINLPFADAFRDTVSERLGDPRQDTSKDTLPSMAKVENILEVIASLSLEERYQLVQEIVKSPDWVNLVLKAIATQMAGGK